MKKFRAFGLGSAGQMEIETAVPSGNAAHTRIRLTEGQWTDASCRRLPDGIELTIIGDYELTELADFLTETLRRMRGNGSMAAFEGDDL